MIRLPLVLMFSALLFSAGVYGVLARRNAVMVLMAIELMLNAVNVNLVAFASSLHQMTGQVFALFVIAVAAAEVGMRARDRDLALPHARVDQRGRGEPAQVVNLLAAEGEVVYEATTGGLWFVEHAWIVVLLPLVSAAFILFFGSRTPGKGAVYGIAAVGASFVFSLGVLLHFVQGGGPFEGHIDWFTIGPLHLELGVLIDGLTGVMLVVVTAVSLCVHIYSLGYMHGDERFTWFYVVLSLFTAAMLTVVVANNLIQLLVGWEVMGVCSYLLIGHWWEVKENSTPRSRRSSPRASVTSRSLSASSP